MNLFPVIVSILGAVVAALSLLVLRWTGHFVRRRSRRAQLSLGIVAWILEAVVLAVVLLLVSGAFLADSVLRPGTLNKAWVEVVIALSLLAALVALSSLWGVPTLADVGLKTPARGRGSSALRDCGFGLLLGVLAAGIIPVAGAIGGWDHLTRMAPFADVVADLGIAAVFFAATGLFEELLFRGCVFALVARVAGLPVAWVVSVLIFSLAHGANSGASVMAIIGVAAAAVALTLGLLRTGALWLSIGFHASWNWALGSLYGYAVSGIGLDSVMQRTIDPTAPSWATGGAFGPEAGLFGILAFGLAGVAIWLYTGWTYGRAGTASLFPAGTPEVIAGTRGSASAALISRQ
jgi:membrane protease YdiL (CAAX protease family)